MRYVFLIIIVFVFSQPSLPINPASMFNVNSDGWVSAFEEITGKYIYQFELFPPTDSISLRRSYGHFFGTEVHALIMSRDGKNLYAVSYNGDALHCFQRDGFGNLQYQRCFITRDRKIPVTEEYSDKIIRLANLQEPLSIAITYDGKQVFVGGYYGLLIFDRAKSSGELSYRKTYQKFVTYNQPVMYYPTSIRETHTGKHLYVASAGDSSICWVQRNVVSGEIVFKNRIQGKNGTIPGLVGIKNILISHDDKNLYAIGYFGNAVSSFKRDQISGNLKYLGSTTFQKKTFRGLERPYDCIISPDQKFVYVISVLDKALCWLSRDDKTGLLEYRGSLTYEAGNVGLNGGCNIAITPDGNNLFVASSGDNVIACFRRNKEDGSLTHRYFYHAFKEARTIVISPDGRHAYIGASTICEP